MAQFKMRKRDVFEQVESFLDTSGNNYNYHKDKWNSFLDKVFCSSKVCWVDNQISSDVMMAECVFEVVPCGEVVPLPTVPSRKLRLKFSNFIVATEATSLKDDSGEQRAQERKYAQVIFQNLLKSRNFRPISEVRDSGCGTVVGGDLHYGDQFSVLKARVRESDKIVTDQYIRGGTQKHAPDIPAFVVVHRKRRKLGRFKMTADHCRELNHVLGDVLHRWTDRCNGDGIVCTDPRQDIVCRSRFACLLPDDDDPAE